jgi:hypothetical protein
MIVRAELLACTICCDNGFRKTLMPSAELNEAVDMLGERLFFVPLIRNKLFLRWNPVAKKYQTSEPRPMLSLPRNRSIHSFLRRVCRSPFSLPTERRSMILLERKNLRRDSSSYSINSPEGRCFPPVPYRRREPPL